MIAAIDLLFLTVPATHAFGSSTGHRSSPGGRRSWGRGRGRPVCRSSRVRTWGTPFSCLRAYTIRRDPLHITYSGRTVPVAAAISLMRAPVPRSPPACLDRRRTLPPRLRGAAELKFVPTKCRPHPVHLIQATCTDLQCKKRREAQKRRDGTVGGRAPSLKLFAQGMRAPETREKYTRTLRKVVCGFLEEILEGTVKERVARLVKSGGRSRGGRAAYC